MLPFTPLRMIPCSFKLLVLVKEFSIYTSTKYFSKLFSTDLVINLLTFTKSNICYRKYPVIRFVSHVQNTSDQIFGHLYLPKKTFALKLFLCVKIGLYVNKLRYRLFSVILKHFWLCCRPIHLIFCAITVSVS